MQKFVKAEPFNPPTWQELVKQFGITEVRAKAVVKAAAATGDTIWINDTYQVNMRTASKSGWFDESEEVYVGFDLVSMKTALVWLSIKRRDKEVLHDWRELQGIKNMLVGPDCEAFELYPAESRLVDTANQYHLWVFSNPEVQMPIGFTSRTVFDNNPLRTKNRPFADSSTS